MGAFGLGGYSRPLEGTALIIVSVLLMHVIAVVFSWLVMRNRENAFEKTGLLALIGLLGSLGWGPGTLAILNAAGDTSLREQDTRVLDFREHTAKNKTSYYVVLAAWPPLEEPEELQVEASDYARAKANGKDSAAKIRVGHGRLGIEHLPLDWGTPHLTLPP
jgi:hypothetical protein